MDLAFFRSDGDDLVPTPIAASMWSANQMHGVAVSGALARALEAEVRRTGLAGLVPARLTVDLFRPATMEPCQVEAELVRKGRRIALVDATMTQGGQRVARASGLFLVASETAEGEVWSPAERPAAPSEDEVPTSDDPRPPFFRSSKPWSQEFTEHQNADHKMSWNTGLPIVVGEQVTPFQVVASMADGGSLVTNWGTRGVEYINTDITLALARAPAGLEIGLAALDRVEHNGIAVGTAAVFDRQGPLGNVMVTSLANAKRSVDFEGIRYTDDGRRVR